MSVERKKGFSVLPSQTPECPGLKLPRRPSGADKKQKPAEKEGGQGRKRNRRDTDGIGHPTLNSNDFAANQHCQTLWRGTLSQNR
jgi:hypothetical protein